MRKLNLYLCTLVLGLTGCAPSGDPRIRAREQRAYPDPTMGTDNHESQVYKTQILASPSAPGLSDPLPASGAADSSAPAPAQRKTNPSKVKAAPAGA